jgi:aryl sulfotransferase
VPHRYVSGDEDSARWDDFAFGDGDIVISTRTKHGTTWMQMICALLVFRTPDLPAPLAELSPWLDWLVLPADDVRAALAAQEHRRFVKTHTPLDGLPLDRRATYVVVARDPLDARVSHLHHRRNLDRELMSRLSGEPVVAAPGDVTDHDWLVEWIDRDADPQADLDSLDGVMWHLSDAWSRREEPNVVLVHYDDLTTDLDAEMRRLAARLDIDIPEPAWPALVEAASLDHMRADASRFAPGPRGLFKEPTAFFRAGGTAVGRGLLTPVELVRYQDRLAALAPSDLVGWLDRP